MTAIENDAQVTQPADDVAAEVKNPTYLDLVKATWKLAYDLSAWGRRKIFCVDGVNEYLRHFSLPELKPLDGNMELADTYLEAWHAYQTWNATGEADPADDRDARERLGRRIRTHLRREQPKSIATMNEWLTELGLELLEPPAPPRHAGMYRITHNATTEVNSARIAQALNAQFPGLNVEVSYDRRLA